MASPCDLIAEQMGGLFNCTKVNSHIRIRTPFLYPDGDIIDVYFREHEKGTDLSDLGSTLLWLNTQTPVERRTKRQLQIVHEVCVTHNIQFAGGALTLRVENPGELARAVTRLAQAASRVADISFTLRARNVSAVVDEVAEFLKERRIPFTPNEKTKGYSGKEYAIDFFTTPQRQHSYVALLSTGNRSTALELAEKTLGIWRDLDILKQEPKSGPAIKFVTLFDDTQDVWLPEHERMLQRDSEIAHWSDPSEFLQKLAA